jgi:uncharacterized protein (TIGR03905 family)
METYKTNGVCSREIKFKSEGGKLISVDFIGGCPGNLLGIKTLVEGMEVNEIIEKFKDVKCGAKSTSCPAQLSKALSEKNL